MKNRSFKRFAVVICIVSALVIGANLIDGGLLSSLLYPITGGMQEVTAGLFGGETAKSYDELSQETEKLREENAALRASLADYYDLQRENERLWKYYGLKSENPQMSLLPACVIRRDPNDDYYSFTIDVGSSGGVAENNPVVTEYGLVGYVSEVSFSSAKVKTLLSAQASVGAIDSITADSGVVTGNPLYCDENLTTLTAISAGHSIKEGDLLVTSGLSGIYPKNLIIGEVVKISVDKYDSTALALVRPFQDLRTVSSVAVITDFDGKYGKEGAENGE